MCEKDLRPCSSYPCLKNGTCTNLMNGTVYDFECKCKFPYFGRYCEQKIKLCLNVTCSKQGWCYENDTIPMCKCFTGFDGLNCEIVSQELMKAKAISNVAAYLAIGCIVVFFSVFIFMDISKIFISNSNSIKKAKISVKLVNNKVTAPAYVESEE